MPETEVVPPTNNTESKRVEDMKPFERRQYFMRQAADEAQRNREMKNKVEKAIIDALYDADDPDRVEWRPIVAEIEKQFPTGNVRAVWNDLWNDDKIEAVDKGATPNFYKLTQKITNQVRRERDASRKAKK